MVAIEAKFNPASFWSPDNHLMNVLEVQRERSYRFAHVLGLSGVWGVQVMGGSLITFLETVGDNFNYYRSMTLKGLNSVPDHSQFASYTHMSFGCASYLLCPGKALQFHGSCKFMV